MQSIAAGRYYVVPAPFAPTLESGTGAGRAALVSTDEGLVRVFSADGVQILTADLSDLRSPITDRLLERFISFTSEAGSEKRTAYEAAPHMAHVPAMIDIHVDWRGQVWIRPYTLPWDSSESLTRWVLAADGRRVWSVPLPSDTQLLDVRDGRILGIRTDEFDREFLVLYDFNW